LALAALGLAALAGGAQAQTLEEALAATYENNPTLLAARAELRAVNEGVPQAMSGWRPNVVLEGEIGGQYGKSGTEDVAGSFDSSFPKEVQLVVTQPLYRGGRTAAQLESAEALVQAQRALLKETEQTVLLAAVQAYMDVWAGQAVVEINRNNEERLRRQRNATLDRFNVGELTRTDVAQSESALAGATADRIVAEGRLEIAKAVFRQVIGLEPVSVGQAPPLEGLPPTVDDAVAISQIDDPTVVAARNLESSALADIRERLGRLLPEVSLVGVLSYGDDTGFSGGTAQAAQILAQVSVPIYQQGLTNSQVREAKQRASQRRLEINEALRLAEQEAVSAWHAIIAARAAIVSILAQVRAAQIALDGVIQESTVGARTVLDILDAEQDVLDAQLDLVQAQREEVVASYRLAAAIGRLTALDLDLPVAIYDPEIDYEKVRDAWFMLDAPGAQ